MKDLFADTVPAIRALIAALGGVFVSKWWFAGDWPRCIALVVAVIVIAWAIEWFGERFFLPGHPVAAVRIMEWWVLAPIGIGIAGSAALIVAAVQLTVPESVKDPILKETGGAVATAISTFLTAMFVTNLGDKDKSVIGDRIKTRLRRHYARPPADGGALPARVRAVPKGSEIEQLLYSNFYDDLDGWDRETRVARAKEIAEALNSG